MHDMIALFGEAERGAFQKAHVCQSLQQLVDYFGQPPPQTTGLAMAIQAILSNRQLIFFRVEEEGFSLSDYYRGLHKLESTDLVLRLVAIGLPGVGDEELLRTSQEICRAHHSILLMTEQDLYDYLMTLPRSPSI